MPRLRKPELLEKVLAAIRLCGWQFIVLTPGHPFRIRIYRDSEAYTFRVYIWNLTHGGGPARPPDEYRIQITGITRFEREPYGKTLILGWWAEADVFAGFDYRKHSGPLGASPSIQIRESFLREAYERGFSPCDKGNREVAIAFKPSLFCEYVRSLEDLHDAGRVRTDLDALRAVAENPLVVNDSDLENVTAARRKAIASVLRNLRDTSFQDRVLTSYSHRCAMCGLQMDLVEAAHIVPVRAPNSTDETCNGLALCALHHKAYDRSVLDVSDTYRVVVSNREKDRLTSIGHDGGLDSFVEALRPLILLPPAIGDRPRIEYLRRSREIRRWVP
ncbi:MAG: HNH endonuclease [Nitrospirota bacterium]